MLAVTDVLGCTQVSQIPWKVWLPTELDKALKIKKQNKTRSSDICSEENIPNWTDWNSLIPRK